MTDDATLRTWLAGLEAPAPATKALPPTSGPEVWNTTSPGLGAFMAGGPAGAASARLDRLERDLGPPWLSIPAAACWGWMADNFGTAELKVYERDPDPHGTDEPIEDHEVLEILDNTEGMTADELWTLCLASHKFWGMTFLRVVDTIAGRPSRLMWVPPRTPCTQGWFMEPVRGGFEHWMNGRVAETLPPEKVVYVRDLVDPQDPKRGVSRFRSGLRAAVGHNQADDLASFVLGNLTVSKAFVPDTTLGVTDSAIRDGLRNSYRTAIAMRGDLPILAAPGRFEDIGKSPGEMGLDFLPDRMERNLCALLGVSAMSVGLAAGATMQSYANQEQADKQSWHNGLVPVQERFAAALTRGLLRRLDPDPATYVGWDRSRVTALQPNRSAQIADAVAAFGGGLVTRDEGRAEFGLAALGPEGGGDEFAGGASADPARRAEAEARADATADRMAGEPADDDRGEAGDDAGA